MRKIEVGYHNEFDFIVRDAKTGKIKQEVKAYNIILNRFWDLFLGSVTTSSARCFAHIAFGSGTAVPAIGDTNLGSRIGSKAMANRTLDWSTTEVDGIIKVKGNVRLEAADYVGSNISEVGISDNGTTLVTKSLLKDANGNPIAIVKTASDVIDIYATFYVNVPKNMATWGEYTSTNGGIGAYLTFNNYLSYSTSSGSKGYFKNEAEDIVVWKRPSIAMSIPNKNIVFTVPTLTAGEGNVGGLIGFEIAYDFRISIPISAFVQPTIIKEVIGTGDGVTKDFQNVFGRIINNANLKTYVDDVISADVSYDYEFGRIGGYYHERMIFTKDAATKALIYENLDAIKYPIGRYRVGRFKIYATDDLNDWGEILYSYAGSFSTNTWPAPANAKRYNIVAPLYDGETALFTYIDSSVNADKHIHFGTAPAVGKTIALTYDTACIAKDDAHVINGISFTLNFNEYTPA